MGHTLMILLKKYTCYLPRARTDASSAPLNPKCLRHSGLLPAAFALELT